MKDAALIPVGAMTMSDSVHESVLTCPKCGFASTETMPADACQFFYECKGCGAVLKPNPGDCCVFCSLCSVECPPIQSKHYCYGSVQIVISPPVHHSTCQRSTPNPTMAL